MSGGTVSIRLSINGESVTREVEPRLNLVDFLRDELGLTGTRWSCEHGVCGACTVLIDGALARGCLVFAAQLDGSRVETIEGLSRSGVLADLQAAFQLHNAVQCGFCSAGMLLSAETLLRENRAPSRADIRHYLSGNYCRCTGYHAIIDAVEEVAKSRAAKGPSRKEGAP
ncbi:MAG: (2Fe-2S)-binding protein [Stellaceae bacterium]|jgi:carbon-monoxide dehydrogenase small subunit